VIPLYNYGSFLGECVDSILAQEGVEVDLLIIDDASTDDSLEIARAIAATDDRVHVKANPVNIGMVPTINEGLWEVDGEYLVKFDADDILTPGALARATALLDSVPSVGFAYGFPAVFRSSPPPAARTRVRSWTVWSGQDWLRIRCRRGGNVIMQPEVVMRASALHQAGKYKSELPHGSDFEMWLRLATIADVGRINGAHQGYYRVHERSMQRTVNAGHLTDLQAHRDVYATLFAEAGNKLPVPQLGPLASRALALNAIDKASRAYDEGRGADEPVSDYVALALDVYPDASGLRQWHTLQRRLKQSPDHAATLPGARARRAWRGLWDRVEWRRWRWSGT
jgi:glycosyltransferase involved in cell wall biosynthesis